MFVGVLFKPGHLQHIHERLTTETLAIFVDHVTLEQL